MGDVAVAVGDGDVAGAEAADEDLVAVAEVGGGERDLRALGGTEAEAAEEVAERRRDGEEGAVTTMARPRPG